MYSIININDRNGDDEKFELFSYDKKMLINVGNKGTIQLKLSDRSFAVFEKDELLYMLSYMQHNHYFLGIPKYYLIECIDSVYNPSTDKRKYYGISINE